MKVYLETLKNRNAGALPILWGTGRRWKYTEGSRNKIRSEGLTRMRAKGRLKGVELGNGGSNLGRRNFGANATEPLHVSVKAGV